MEFGYSSTYHIVRHKTHKCLFGNGFFHSNSDYWNRTDVLTATISNKARQTTVLHLQFSRSRDCSLARERPGIGRTEVGGGGFRVILENRFLRRASVPAETATLRMCSRRNPEISLRTWPSLPSLPSRSCSR